MTPSLVLAPRQVAGSIVAASLALDVATLNRQRGFRFVEASHTYWKERQQLLGVSEILRRLNLADTTYFTIESRERGHRVHRAAYLYDLGELDWNTVRHEDRPYVEAYALFRAEVGGTILLSEQPLFDDLYGFAGTLDRLILLRGQPLPTLYDLKTGPSMRWHALQLAAYKLLYERLVRDQTNPALERLPKAIGERYCVRLKRNGRYKLSPPYSDPHDEKRFLYAALLAGWQQEAA